MPSLPPLPFAVLRSSRPSERLLWAPRPRTHISTLGGLQYWTAVPAPSMPVKSLSRSTTLRFATITVEALQRRSEEHTSELQSLAYLVCRLLLEKKKKIQRLILK